MGSQAAKGPKTAVGKAAVLAPVSGEIPVMMPEKLPVTKVNLHFFIKLDDAQCWTVFASIPDIPDMLGHARDLSAVVAVHSGA